jgi:hypothetical protein
MGSTMSYWVWTKANYEWPFSKAPLSIMYDQNIIDIAKRAGMWFVQDNPDAIKHRFFCHIDVKIVSLQNPDRVRYFAIIDGEIKELHDEKTID